MGGGAQYRSWPAAGLPVINGYLRTVLPMTAWERCRQVPFLVMPRTRIVQKFERHLLQMRQSDAG